MNRRHGSDPDATRIAAAAAAWLAEDGPAAGLPAAAGRPVPIRSPAGAADGWFVPLVGGEHLLGYLRFTAGGARRGLSSFQRRRGELAGCPLAADWLDPVRITARARVQATAGAAASAPVLSYDGSPERLAWRVDFSDPDGQPFSVCVAGTSAWRCAGAG